VKESACFARRRQRSACSFKVDKSIGSLIGQREKTLCFYNGFTDQ
jgi:hypothetical protein